MHHALIINVKRSLAEKELRSKRGKTSRFVEQRFKDIADRRKRSNLCFAIWFSESVSVEVHEGLSYEEAKAVVDEKKSSEESVKMFDKSGTGKVLKHFALVHQINTEAQPPSPANISKTEVIG